MKVGMSYIHITWCCSLRSSPVDTAGAQTTLRSSKGSSCHTFLGLWLYMSLEFVSSLRTRILILFIFITLVNRTRMPSVQQNLNKYSMHGCMDGWISKGSLLPTDSSLSPFPAPSCLGSYFPFWLMSRQWRFIIYSQPHGHHPFHPVPALRAPVLCTSSELEGQSPVPPIQAEGPFFQLLLTVSAFDIKHPTSPSSHHQVS